MKIERVIFKNLRALRARDDSFLDPDRSPHAAVCLRGLNGSGKTTYLEVIAQLWQWFRLCTKRRTLLAPTEPLLNSSTSAAVLLSDLPGPEASMWIAWSIRVDEVWLQPRVLEYWDALFTRAEIGIGSPFTPPNVVCIEAEKKYVPDLAPDELTTLRSAAPYLPVARFDPNDRSVSHLEIVLRALFLTRHERWVLLAKYMGELRPGLELIDPFDETSQHSLFRLHTGELLGVEHLSAGERSLLINLCMILRWLSPGGIVLLDEPELHQHISVMRGSLAVLDSIISREFNGQLIVASHAPEVWDHFRRTDALIDLGGPAA